ncbi:protein translocase subunit SecF [Micromonosporaceae bacterium DT55]|uniref:protein translocase subunit SecF n=1 Tax=Melissospora conviva TaxID=3388432 RepID=UPI003C223E21
MAGSGLATRLYQGEAGIDIVGRRKLWYSIAIVVALVALLSFGFRGFAFGIDFTGGTKLSVPTSVGTLEQAEAQVNTTLGATNGGEVDAAQRVGNAEGEQYEFRTAELSPEEAESVKVQLADAFGLDPQAIGQNGVSASWGDQVSNSALRGLLFFLVLVSAYLIIRLEWRMAVAAVSSLLLNLTLTAGVYSLVGWEVTPSTVIGFLTILGFALYDVVVVFDKVQENTAGITGRNNQTYGEAANLAVNQTLMRSINTSVVALLPVGGLLFIGPLLGADTLKDLGLVLFVGMALAVYSSLFFATPLLVTLKDREPRIATHNKRVLARRSAIERGEIQVPKVGAGVGSDPALATAAPRPGARPVAKRQAAKGRPGGNRPSGAKNR